MNKAEIASIVQGIAKAHSMECVVPMEVFGTKDVGVRFRDPAKTTSGLIPKATFAITEDDTAEQIEAKAITAVACIKLGIQTGWNRAAPAPLDMKAQA